MKWWTKFYDSLGNSKAQKFRRFILILIILASLIAYGFHSGALKINLSKQVAVQEASGE